MSAYKKILVVINPQESQQPALERAAILARKESASLVLLSCIYDNSYEMTNALNNDERYELKSALLNAQSKRLTEYINSYSDIKDISCKVIWHKTVHQGVIDEAILEKCDLIVKASKAHNKLSQKLFTPTDWHILRNSPINVLMVKHHDWPKDGNLVASVCVGHSDEEHLSLNNLIVEQADKFARMLNANLHLVNTYTGAPVHISIEVPQFSAQEFNKNLLQRHLKDMHSLAAKYELSENRLHVKEGLPEDVVPDICESLDAELLILGSVGRKGLSALFLGNTAEHIIDQINCDTLVIKS